MDDFDHWRQVFHVADEEGLRSLFQLDLRKTSYKGLFKVEEGKTIWGTSDDWDSGYNVRKGGFPADRVTRVGV